jgi:ABC-2 type transport system ATP-binding protein
MTAPIVLDHLTKFYGRVRGIEDLSLEVREGEIFGFLGPNGAGKSTTIRTMLDFIRPTHGTATLLGLDSRSHSVAIHRHIGYLPGELAMYDRMTGRQMLEYFAALRGMSDDNDIAPLAARFDLDLDRKIRTYSSGNRQKVGLIQAFLHRPRLLILDEPTNGLDPIVQYEFYALLRQVAAQGATVFLSSHVLPEVERITHRAAIIRHGKLLTVADIEVLKREAQRRLELTFATPVDPHRFRTIDSVVSAEVTDVKTLVVTVAGSVGPVMRVAAAQDLLNVVSHEGDLESAFLAYYQDDIHVP